MGIISAKLRASARGQQCTFNTSYCNHDPETTVLCHLPSEVKGIGNKSDDFHAAFGCSACHEVIDQHRLPAEAELFYCFRALQRTLKIWVAKGLVVVPGDITKTRPKKKTKWPTKPIPARLFRAKGGDNG